MMDYKHEKTRPLLSFAKAKTTKSAVNLNLLEPAGYVNVYNTKTLHTRFRSIITDQRRRGCFEQHELEHVIVKSVLASQLKEKKARPFSRLIAAQPIMRKLTQSATITRVRNRCIVSGRSSTIGGTGLSRITFRRMAGIGQIPGLRKI